MFLSIDQLKKSLSHLESIHPFYGITFLACKVAELPIGTSISFPISDKETVFLNQYYKPDESSKYFYRVFRPSDKKLHWVEGKKYASSTLQAIRTQGEFAKSFTHDPNSDQWGWETNYVDILTKALSRNLNPRGRPIPAFDLATWLYREREWPANITAEDVIETFCNEFLITEDEKAKLFDLSVPKDRYAVPFFQEEAIHRETLRGIIGNPPDAKPEEGGTLAFLECQGVGPAMKISFEPAERLSLITGDNGLGKTFLLEIAWWALTGQWAGLPVYPRQGAKDAKITFQIAGEKSKSEKGSINYIWNTHSWPFPRNRPTIPGLIVYARVDGSFAVWDPVRNYAPTEKGTVGARRLFVFTRRQVWDGLDGEIEGLIRDWGRWQSNPEKHPFETFKKVLHRLSPPDLGPLEPGELQRLPDDPRDIPTLKHPYGEVPIVCASAGVRRILTLAYLIVWAWNEHKIHSDLAHKPHQKRMVVLVDEMEAHLHPLWQRVVLPALLDVRAELARDLHAQFLVATHSPLVMASVEPIFDPAVDKLFHLDLTQNREVMLKELPFIRYGPVDAWLTSPVFELRHPRNSLAEEAIETAKALQTQRRPEKEEVIKVTEMLTKALSADDEFWPRWVFFAEQQGVKL